MIKLPALADILGALARAEVDQYCFRAVDLAPLMGKGAAVAPFNVQEPRFLRTTQSAYRFNPKGIEVLYVSDTNDTAYNETSRIMSVFDKTSITPAGVFQVKVKSDRLLDLLDQSIVQRLGLTADDLFGKWAVKSPHANSQILGRAVFDSERFDGIRFPSAAMRSNGKSGINFCLFAERIRANKNARVSFDDPNGLWKSEQL